jgi:predicted RNase H-like HicB family nuclease
MNDLDGYTVVLKEIIEEDGSYWAAYHPEFGFCACSGCGDTPEKALNELNNARTDIVYYYIETKKHLPMPFDTNTALYGAKWAQYE